MTKNLRSFLEEYEAQHPGDVVHLESEISSVQEVTALAQKLENMDKFPILILENLRMPNGERARYPLVTNVFASRARCAGLIGCTPHEVCMHFANLTRGEARKPEVISRAEAPVKQVVKTGDQINLFEFPALVHHDVDPGPYLTGGYFTTYDPDTGIDNSSLHRGWIKARNLLRPFPAKHQHSWHNMKKCEARGQMLKAAYWIGHHPVACLGAQSKLPYPGSHYEAMGGLMREPLRLVPSETLGDDFLVPADAEVVIEGIIDPAERYPEGPFGEYTRYIVAQTPNPQMLVTAVTHRKDPLWHDILVGHADNHVNGGFAIESVIYERVKEYVPSLKNVYLPLSGSCRFHAYMQFEDPKAADVRKAFCLAIPLDLRVTHLFAFDSDIDIFNEREVLWALASRTQFDQDLQLFPKMLGLDPADAALITKAGIDCTKPIGEVFYENLRVDQKIFDGVDVEKFIPAERLARVTTERL